MAVIGLEKWYFDILTEDDSYLFLYFAHTKILFYRECRFFIAIRSPHEKKITRIGHGIRFSQLKKAREGSFTFRHGGLEIGSSKTTMRFSRRDLDIDLVYRSVVPRDFAKDAFRIEHRGKRILWHPVSLKAEVRGTIDAAGRTWRFNGCNGYIDYLNIDYLPIRLGMRVLIWGRVHHPLIDLTYTYTGKAEMNPGKCLLLAEVNGTPLTAEDFTIEVSRWGQSKALGIRFPLSYVLRYRGPRLRLEMRLSHTENPIESEFIKDQDLKSDMKTRLFSILTRSPKSIKFVSKADIDLEDPAGRREIRGVSCIDEYVLFNNRLRRGSDAVP